MISVGGQHFTVGPATHMISILNGKKFKIYIKFSQHLNIDMKIIFILLDRSFTL
jgi:hypothetical protein